MASSNTLLTPTIIAKEALMMLENSMVMGRLVHKQFKKEFAKVGNTITIRKPNKFAATKSATRSNSNLAETSTTLAVATQAHVSWAFSSAELTTTIEDYSERYIKPACNTLANTVDGDLTALYKYIYNQVGTPGTTPATFAALGAAQQRLDEEAVPSEGRVAVINPAANWALADGLKGTFSQKKATDILTKGALGTIANLSIHMDQNIKTHTTGLHDTGSTPLVNDTVVSGDSTVTTSGWANTTAVLAAGDVFTFADVYAVNPVSGDSTGVLRQFTVTTAVTSGGGGAADITFTPAIITTGAYKTCTAVPSNGAAITVVGTESTGYPQNLIFHPDCFALVSLPMQMPSGVWGARETFNDLSIRVVKQYDIENDEEVIRLDILYGVKCIYPELGVRLTG